MQTAKDTGVSSAWPLSVLAKASRDMVRLHPFPHLVIENALDPSLYAALSFSFPSSVIFVGDQQPGSNQYHWLRACRVVKEQEVHLLWKDFVQFHTSREFFRDVLRVFGDAIAAEYPALAATNPVSWSTATRFVDGARDIALDCLPVYCSPVLETETSSRGPHLDREVSLYGGLLYMRLAEDDSEGGDLVISTFEEHFSAAQYDSGNHLIRGPIADFETVKYKANTLVFFINTARSIHRVTPRSLTPYPRRHVSILGELGAPLFAINKLAVGSGHTNSWYGNR